MNGKFAGLAALSAAAALISCGAKPHEEAPPEKAVVAVHFTAVKKGAVNLTETMPGKTDVEKRGKIISPIAGKIARLDCLPGAMVKEGETIALVRTRESDAAISGALILLRQATSEDRRAEARQVLDLANSTQNSVELKSPISGAVISRSVNVDEMVAENAEIASIADVSSLDFIAEASPAASTKLRAGQKGTIRFDYLPGVALSATIVSVGVQADSQSHYVNIRCAFSGPPGGRSSLKINMPGIFTAVMGVHPHALLAPKSALLRNDETGAYSLVTISPDSLSKTIPVEIGPAADSLVEISGAGVSEAMPIITQGNYGLADSTKVTNAGPEKP